MNMDEFNAYLIKLAEANLGLRRKVVLLKKFLEKIIKDATTRNRS